jgi:hypothetical protein
MGNAHIANCGYAGYSVFMTATPTESFLEVDARRRLTLGRVGRPGDQRYLATTEPDGTIILRPAVVMTELEARLMTNPALVERIEANRQDPTRLVKHQRRTTSTDDPQQH